MSNSTNFQQQNSLELGDLRDVKIKKLQMLKNKGINPYTSVSYRNITIEQLVEQFDELLNSNDSIVVAGRIINIRSFGKLSFVILKSEIFTIQILISSKDLENTNLADNLISFDDLNLLDVGDFVEFKGRAMLTQKGERSILATDMRLLSKSIETLPDQYYGLKDEEDRYRKRYIDILYNNELRQLFYKKTLFWQTIRNFMIDHGFLEVETPVLESISGGADATPFVTHHNTLDIDVYLRISMGELWQKKLLIAGFEKTFEIGRQFRNEGQSKEHLQDYTQMEFYWAYANYKDGMQLVEKLYKKIALEVYGTYEFEIRGHKVDLGKDWGKIDYFEVMKERFDIDISRSTLDQLRNKCTEYNVHFELTDQKGRLLDLLWKSIRNEYAGPAFLINHPTIVSPLAKSSHLNPSEVERFQIIIAGSELGNGYSELNDPIDQNERFIKQQRLRDSGDSEAQMHDKDYVKALEYGMPPACGFGLSERVFSFLAGKPIKEMVLFPLLKPGKNSE